MTKDAIATYCGVNGIKDLSVLKFSCPFDGCASFNAPKGYEATRKHLNRDHKEEWETMKASGKDLASLVYEGEVPDQTPVETGHVTTDQATLKITSSSPPKRKTSEASTSYVNLISSHFRKGKMKKITPSYFNKEIIEGRVLLGNTVTQNARYVAFAKKIMEEDEPVEQEEAVDMDIEETEDKESVQVEVPVVQVDPPVVEEKAPVVNVPVPVQVEEKAPVVNVPVPVQAVQVEVPSVIEEKAPVVNVPVQVSSVAVEAPVPVKKVIKRKKVVARQDPFALPVEEVVAPVPVVKAHVPVAPIPQEDDFDENDLEVMKDLLEYDGDGNPILPPSSPVYREDTVMTSSRATTPPSVPMDLDMMSPKKKSLELPVDVSKMNLHPKPGFEYLLPWFHKLYHSFTRVNTEKKIPASERLAGTGDQRLGIFWGSAIKESPVLTTHQAKKSIGYLCEDLLDFIRGRIDEPDVYDHCRMVNDLIRDLWDDADPSAFIKAMWGHLLERQEFLRIYILGPLYLDARFSSLDPTKKPSVRYKYPLLWNYIQFSYGNVSGASPNDHIIDNYYEGMLAYLTFVRDPLDSIQPMEDRLQQLHDNTMKPNLLHQLKGLESILNCPSLEMYRDCLHAILFETYSKSPYSPYIDAQGRAFVEAPTPPPRAITPPAPPKKHVLFERFPCLMERMRWVIENITDTENVMVMGTWIAFFVLNDDLKYSVHFDRLKIPEELRSMDLSDLPRDLSVLDRYNDACEDDMLGIIYHGKNYPEDYVHLIFQPIVDACLFALPVTNPLLLGSLFVNQMAPTVPANETLFKNIDLVGCLTAIGTDFLTFEPENLMEDEWYKKDIELWRKSSYYKGNEAFFEGLIEWYRLTITSQWIQVSYAKFETLESVIPLTMKTLCDLGTATKLVEAIEKKEVSRGCAKQLRVMEENGGKYVEMKDAHWKAQMSQEEKLWFYQAFSKKATTTKKKAVVAKKK